MRPQKARPDDDFTPTPGFAAAPPRRPHPRTEVIDVLAEALVSQLVHRRTTDPSAASRLSRPGQTADGVAECGR